MENNIARIEDELGEARQSLQQTLADVGQKVEAGGTQLQPDNLVNRNPLLSLCIAGALGLAAGSRGEKPVVVAAFVLGGLLGLALKQWPFEQGC